MIPQQLSFLTETTNIERRTIKYAGTGEMVISRLNTGAKQAP